MVTINTNLATNPFIAKPENPASSSNVKLDRKTFDSIDSKAEARMDDTVNFSSFHSKVSKAIICFFSIDYSRIHIF